MNWLFADAAIIKQGIQAFCWMLIHSCWQGLLLAILTGIVLLLTKKAPAAMRYTIITGLLLIFLVACGYTFIHEWKSGHSTANSITGTFSGITILHNYGINYLPAALAQYCSDHATLIVAIWFAIFSIRCWQMSRAVGYVRSIRTSQHQVPGLYWKDKMIALTQQLQIKKTVTLLESGITKIPVVIGHLKPVIYMPLGLLANLPPDQVEAVLLHELAHIRRNDYLVNLLQYIAETIFFFNPGLLWVSSLLKQEREHCCDDIALSHTGNKKQFIQALISFKEHVVYGKSYALAFPGKKSHLLHRVTRIIQNRNNSLSGGEKLFLLGSLFICFLLLGTMANKKGSPLKPIPPAKEMYAEVFTGQNFATALVTAKERKEVAQKKVQKKPEIISKKETAKTPVSIQVEPVEKNSYEEGIVTEVNARHAYLDAQQVLKYPSQVVSGNEQAARDRQQAISDREQSDRNKLQVERDKLQADKDRAQAELDRKQAERDREQAVRDRQQALKDREQANRDRLQAEKDKAQAELDRKQADKDREQAQRDRIQSEKYKATAAAPTM